MQSIYQHLQKRFGKANAVRDNFLAHFVYLILINFVTLTTLFPQQVLLTNEELAWLGQNETIRVNFWQHPPYLYLKDGKVVGIAVDFLNKISENTGIKFQYKNKLDKFTDVLNGLKDHKGPDLVTAIMPTPKREKVILFTESYINSPRFIFTRDDSPFVSSIENLFGKKVAVVENFAVHDYLYENFPNIDQLVCNNNEEALRAVSSGKAFAFIGDLISTPVMINEFGLNNLKAACPSGFPDHHLAIGIRNDWPALRNIIDKGLKDISASEKAVIINKWSTVKIEYGITPADVVKRLLLGGLVAALIILGFVVWNRNLNRMVSKRTTELAESEKRFRATFEQAAVGIAHVSTEGNFIRLNNKFCDIVGYTHEEMKTLTFQDITHPEDLDGDVAQVNLLLNGKKEVYTLEKRYFHKKGHIVWVNLTVSLVKDQSGDPLYFVAVVENISVRKKAEETTRISAERFQKIFQTSSASITISNLATGVFTEVNQAFEQIFGYTKQEIVGKSSLDIDIWNNPEDRDRLMPEFLEKGNLRVPALELVRKSGKTAIVDAHFSIMKLEGESYSIAVFSDITERNQAEEALRESEDLLKITEEKAHIGQYSGDFITKRGVWSDEQYRIFGYSSGEIEPSMETVRNHVHPEDREKWLKANQDTIQKNIPYHLDYRIIRKDGTVRTLLSWSTMKRNDDGSPIRTVGITQDITPTSIITVSLSQQMIQLACYIYKLRSVNY